MNEPGVYLSALREQPPLVHNVTNFVAMNIMANVLLAVGASPAMVHAQDEVAEFASIAQALTVNIGTLDNDWVESMAIAASTMSQAGKPWVFDPVGVGATQLRQRSAERLLSLSPTVVRGNASEVMALAGLSGAGRGVDAGDSVEAAQAAAQSLAAHTGGVVAVSGEVDYVTDGQRAFRVANGDAMMARVTATGCSLNGVIAAFIVGQSSTLEATVAAMACYGLAGQRAAQAATGPGSFQVAFLDALYQQTPELLNQEARIEAVA